MQDLANNTALLPVITSRDLLLPKLHALCAGLGLQSLEAQATEVFDLLTESWSVWPARSEPYWPSDITDDHTPVEFSVAFGERERCLRLLAEQQQRPLTATSSWHAGLALNQRLAETWGADLSQFYRIEDLFAPEPDEAPKFSLWHAAIISEHAPPVFKIYLNPQIRGSAGAAELVDQALRRLGCEGARAFLAQRGSDKTRYAYFSLDLVSPSKARTKVYTNHYGVSSAQFAEYCRGVKEVSVSEVQARIDALTGGRAPSDGRPLQTCLAFRGADPVPEVNISVPVRSYAANDEEALDLAAQMLSAEDSARLERGVRAMAGRPLDMGRSLVTYVSLRQEPNKVRTTLYLSPEAYAIAAPYRPSSLLPGPIARHSFVRELTTPSPSKLTFEDVSELIEERKEVLARHPMLKLWESQATYEDVCALVPRGAFFILCFQDVLRLCCQGVADAAIAELLEMHRRGDQGHDRWYLSDLKKMGTTVDVEFLFSRQLQHLRDVAYGQLADVLRSKDDRSRLALVLALEAAGDLFFSRVIPRLELLGKSDGLVFFSRQHEQAEADHSVFNEDGQSKLRGITVARTLLPELSAVIDRTFGSIAAVLDDQHAEYTRLHS